MRAVEPGIEWEPGLRRARRADLTFRRATATERERIELEPLTPSACAASATATRPAVTVGGTTSGPNDGSAG